MRLLGSIGKSKKTNPTAQIISPEGSKKFDEHTLLARTYAQRLTDKTLSQEDRSKMLAEFDDESFITKAETLALIEDNGLQDELLARESTIKSFNQEKDYKVSAKFIASINDIEKQQEFLEKLDIPHGTPEQQEFLNNVINSLLNQLSPERGASLVNSAMKKEIEKASSTDTFLRLTPIGVKLFSAFNFKELNTVFEKELKATLDTIPKKLEMEKLMLENKSGKDLKIAEANIQKAKNSAESALNTIVSMTESPRFPPTLKSVYKEAAKNMQKRYLELPEVKEQKTKSESEKLEDAKRFAEDKVGNMFTLRYFSPLFATSSGEKAIIKGYQEDTNRYKGGIIVGKIIQNAANKPKFVRESFMQPFIQFTSESTHVSRAAKNILS